MKHLKMLGLAVVAAMALTAFTAGSAPATTLEVGATTMNVSVTLTATAEGSITLARTDGSFANTCTSSHWHAHTRSPFTGHVVTGTVTSTSFSNCTRPTTVHVPGFFEVTHIPGTTDGTVFSEQMEVTMGSPFGTLNCKTGATTHIGRLTAATTATNPKTHATLDTNAVLNCGFLVPSATTKGSYWITTPTHLGVSA